MQQRPSEGPRDGVTNQKPSAPNIKDRRLAAHNILMYVSSKIDAERLRENHDGVARFTTLQSVLTAFYYIVRASPSNIGRYINCLGLNPYTAGPLKTAPIPPVNTTNALAHQKPQNGLCTCLHPITALVQRNSGSLNMRMKHHAKSKNNI